MAKGPFKYYVSNKVGGWGWPNADVSKRKKKISKETFEDITDQFNSSD